MSDSRLLRQRLGEVVRYVFDGSARAAAKAAGINQPTLHRILSGKVAEPRLSTVKQLADQYGVPIAWLTGETDSLPMEYVGPGSAPRWWNLVLLYHERARRDAISRIRSTGEGRTPEARAILRHLHEFESRERTRSILSVMVAPFLKAQEPVPLEFLPAWRALQEWETSVFKLAALRLESRGEATSTRHATR